MAQSDLILLAMEESPTVHLLERALRASGYAVVQAREAGTLNRVLLESTPACIVITERLGDESGIHISRAVLERFPTLPIILFAYQDNFELFKKAMKAGVRDFLSPPLRVDDIVDAIRHSQKTAERTGDWVRREVRKTTTSLEKRVNTMETLLRVGQTINQSLNLDDVLTNVVSAAVDLAGSETGQLLLLDESTNELYMRASKNVDEQTARTFRMPVNDSIAGYVLQSGTIYSVDENTPSRLKTAYLVYSLIYVPMSLGKKVIGVLGVDNRTRQRAFQPNSELILQILADYAVSAIQNAQSFQNMEVERYTLQTTLNNIQDGVILLDGERNILFINPAARRTFGLGNLSLTKVPVLEAITNADFANILESIVENPLKHHEIAFDDGRIFNCQYAPISGVGAVVTLGDISHLKMVDRLKSDFIHTISHDLRSPLTSIMGYVELLDRVGPLNDQQRSFVKHVQNSAQNITSLVNDLLDLGRIESGFDARREDVALDAIINFTVYNLEQQMIEKNQVVDLQIQEGIDQIRGNPIRLRQIVDNLIVNAVKYTPIGGKITITLYQEDGQFIFTVSDTGVGIPPSDLPHIFEKFYRASNAPQGTPGTGLGLAIVKSIVDAHHGRIWVESAPGQGTKFSVVLPDYKEEKVE